MSQPYLIADTASAEAPLTRQVSFGAELESSSSEIGEKDSAAVQSQPRTDTALMAHGSVIVGIDDDEGVNTHGGGVLSRRDSLGGAKAASDSNEDDTGDEDDDTRSNSTRTSGSDYSNNAGLSVVRCGDCKLKIPFTVWTFVAMLIPIALVVTVTSINVSASQQELDTIHTYAALVTRLNDCVAALAAERGSSGPWLTRGAAADRTALDTARGATNSACLASYADELRDRAAASGRFLPDYSLFQQTNVPLLAVWRTQVDARTAVGKAARAFYTDFIDNSSRVVTPIANSLQQSARLFSEIKMLITCYNYIGLGRGVGNALAALAPGTATTAALATQAEYQAAYAQSLLARTTVSGLASQRLSDRFAAWEALNTTQLMWSYLAMMASNATVIQAQYSSQWWPVISAGLGGLADVQAAHLSYVASGDIAQASSDFNTAFLVSGVAACLLAAGLLAFQQSRVRGELEGQVVKMRKTKRAVSAFVPRFFLRQMGYTAITQVRSGECTKVALAMLFADIRHFTTVAEGMSCEDLFDWVQGYFKRMTSIVDCNRGNVNQFIGDALFAVFSTAADSVRCAVAMQSDVQQLNIQRLCESNTAGASSPRSYVPVEIGVGIHHDVVALGILGDESRHTCTTIASSVNLASRLEGLTKQLGCRIIASDAVVSQLTSLQRETFRSRRLGAVVVKGSEAAVNVVDIFQSDSRELQQYKSATKEAFEALMLICSEHGGDFSLGTFHEDVSGTPSPASLSPAALVTLPNAIDDTSVAVPAVGTAFQLAPLTRMLSVTHDATPPHVEASSAPPDLETPLLRLRFAELRQSLFQAEERYAVTDRALHEMLSRMLSRKRRIGISFHDK